MQAIIVWAITMSAVAYARVFPCFVYVWMVWPQLARTWEQYIKGTHTHARARAHSLSPACVRAHSLSPACVRAHSLPPACARTHSRLHVHTLTLACMCTHWCTRGRAREGSSTGVADGGRVPRGLRAHVRAKIVMAYTVMSCVAYNTYGLYVLWLM